MAKAQPQTIYDELTEQINDILREKGHFLNADDFIVKALTAKCDQLVRANAVYGWITYARIAQITGDEVRFRYCIENAKRIGPPDEWLHTEAVGLMNLGYFSEASAIFTPLIAPESGKFSSTYPAALCSGAVRAVFENYQALPSMGIDMPAEFPEELVRDASEFMRINDVSDEAISKFLDLAGTVLRKHGCMHAEAGPELKIVDIDTSEVMHLRFRLNLDPSEIADANFELACLVANAEATLPPNVHISFGSSR